MPRLTHVLDALPELAEHLESEELVAARAAAVAVEQSVGRGEWSPDGVIGGVMGAIVAKGLLVRRSTFGGVPATALVGPGDVLAAPAGTSAAVTSWEVLEPATILWLGPTFERAARRWPALSRALLKLSHEGTERVLGLQAIAHLQRTDDRLLALLWQLAQRWGRVTSDGLILPIRLQHRLLAELVGARRPSVTTSLGRLAAEGRVVRREGSWVLRADAANLDLDVCRLTAASSDSLDDPRSAATGALGA
jgi:CRP/FNR family cyclic AMP-dependent transcriptional regulator